MVLKRGRKSEKKKKYLQLCKSEKTAYSFSVHEISRKRFQEEKKWKKTYLRCYWMCCYLNLNLGYVIFVGFPGGTSS